MDKYIDFFTTFIMVKATSAFFNKSYNIGLMLKRSNTAAYNGG